MPSESVHFTDQAVLIRKQPFQDSKLILEFLTFTHGKCRTTWRISSRAGQKSQLNAFDLLNFFELSAIKKNGNDEEITIKDFMPNTSALNLSRNYMDFLFSALWCELLYKVEFDTETGSELYKETLAIAKNLASSESSNAQLHVKHLHSFLNLSSLLYDYKYCAHCHQPSFFQQEGGRLSFRRQRYSFCENFGIICHNCSGHFGDLDAAFVKISHLLASGEFESSEIPPHNLASYLLATLEFIKSQLRINLKSQKIYSLALSGLQINTE